MVGGWAAARLPEADGHMGLSLQQSEQLEELLAELIAAAEREHEPVAA